MPKTVDHDQRRVELIAAASRLIARQGMDGLTVREVAKAAGVSTGVVSHYFSDKRQMLQLIYDVTADRVYAHTEALIAQTGGDVRACLEALLPLDAAAQRGWRVWIAFWGLAIGDGELAKDQQVRARAARALVASVVDAGVRAGRVRPVADPDGTAALVLAAIQGIAVQTVFDARQWPAERQRAMLGAALARLLGL
jgi:AcrR family transcriptional regulator